MLSHNQSVFAMARSLPTNRTALWRLLDISWRTNQRRLPAEIAFKLRESAINRPRLRIANLFFLRAFGKFGFGLFVAVRQLLVVLLTLVSNTKSFKFSSFICADLLCSYVG